MAINSVAGNSAPQSKINVNKKTSTNASKIVTKKAGIIIAALVALASGGIYITQKSNNKTNYNYKLRGVKPIPEERQGGFGQDKYDPNDPTNNYDADSPYYGRTGAYGQDINDANNPYNKQDPQSPYYDPNYGKS